MKFATVFKYTLGIVVLLSNFMSCSFGETSFNDVGKQVAVILQNAHFERRNKTFNSQLSKETLTTYLAELDPSKVFFTKEDVDQLEKKYGKDLCDYFIVGDTMTPAVDIYKLFERRVEERIAYTNKLLDANKFTFTRKDTIDRLRKKAEWVPDTKALDELWDKRIEEQVLSEILRKDTITKLAKEQGKPDPTASEKSPIERLKLRYDRILRTVKDVDSEDMANYLLTAFTHTFDPHTDYMSAREMDRFKSSMGGSLIGIGALLGSEDDGSTKINGIVIGGPADKSNKLKLNDRIVAVDSNNDGEMTDILFMKIDRVVDLIRGKEDSVVRLKVESPDSPGQAKIVTLTRAKVEMKDELAKGEIVEEKLADGKTRRIGILRLPSFYFDMDGGEKKCSNDVEAILKRMNKEDVSALIFDLRGNGGGSLEEVRRMSGFFIGSGPVVQIKDTRGVLDVKGASSPNDKPLFDKPVVVLIDKLSASASEILAAVLQDYGRAVIVGDTTSFGKGTVQQPIEIARFLPALSDSTRAGLVKITTQKFYRVAGGSTQHKGVQSDIVLPTASAAFDSIGESALDHALPYDEISPCTNYTQDAKLESILPDLKKRSQSRVAKDPDFQLMLKEIDRTKSKIDENKLSINKKERQSEIEEQEAFRKASIAERKERYAQIAESDKKNLTLYRMTLEDIKEEKLPLADWEKDKESAMKMAKDETEALDEMPDVPSGLDPETREAINICNDILALETSSTPADKPAAPKDDKADKATSSKS